MQASGALQPFLVSLRIVIPIVAVLHAAHGTEDFGAHGGQHGLRSLTSADVFDHLARQLPHCSEQGIERRPLALKFELHILEQFLPAFGHKNALGPSYSSSS